MYPASAPPRQPKPPPPRQVRVFISPGDGVPAIVEVTEHGRSTDYAVSRIPSDFGLAFQWSHLDPVPVNPGIGREQTYWCVLEECGRSCSCPGFIRWGHCRHADVTLELVQAGKL
jgi:hypothetical protein